MFAFLEHIDDGILSGCTRFAHWFQRLTGRASYFIAKIGVTIAALSSMIMIASYWVKPFGYSCDMLTATMCAFIVLMSLRMATSLDKAEQVAQTSSSRVAHDVTSASTIFWRMLWLGWIVSDSAKITRQLFLGSSAASWFETIVGTCFSIGQFTFYYFVAVHPLPPQTSKVRQWIRGLASGFNKNPVPVSSK